MISFKRNVDFVPSVIGTLSHLSVDKSANRNVDTLMYFKCFALCITVFSFCILLTAHTDLTMNKFGLTGKGRFVL